MLSTFSKIKYLLWIVFWGAFVCQAFPSQPEDDLKDLSLYYEKKDIVVSATRYPKLISQVAENITIISSKEIEGMNPHTVAEILDRIPGMFINFQGNDFGSTALTMIQGSEERHVLVLLDGIDWNLPASGAAETNAIPVEIIDRIEIIKGPASSAWGSSLGGVVNILTKKTGDQTEPSISAKGSYGEKNTQDISAQITGKAGSGGYYFLAKRQFSDGHVRTRYFENNAFYSKLHIPFSKTFNFNVTAGYSEPKIGFGDLPDEDISSSGIIRTYFTTSAISASLTKNIEFHSSASYFDQNFSQLNNTLSTQSDYLDSIFKENKYSSNSKLVWKTKSHTVVWGCDFSKGRLDQQLFSGELLQSYGAARIAETTSEILSTAFYTNDTITIGNGTLTPGIRFDRNDISGSFISPSIGTTYCIGDNYNNIIRGSIARGFTAPPLSWSSGGALFLDPNQALRPEKVWSYQAGIESSAFRYFWIKSNIFYNELNNAFIKKLYGGGAPNYNDLITNEGRIIRKGFEIEAKTLPFYDVSLSTGISFVKLSPQNENGSDEMYTYDIGVTYDDKRFLQANFFGHFVDWDLDPYYEGKYDHFIFDFNLKTQTISLKNVQMNSFLTIHNMFNTSQYFTAAYKNPPRWFEIGIKLAY